MANQIFWGSTTPEQWRIILKQTAFNSIYLPPEDDGSLVGQVIMHQSSIIHDKQLEIERHKEKIKQLQIELSKLKRGKSC